MPTEPEDPYLVPRSTTPAPARRRDPLDTIAHYESGGRNIRQNVVPPEGGYNPSVGRVTGPSSAQGPWQITNSTWRKRAPRAGIDTKQYPTAMSAPVEVQRQVAAKMFSETGYRDWAPYNSRLRAALRRGEGGTEVRQSRDDAYLIAKPKSATTPAQVTETVDDPYLIAKPQGQTPPARELTTQTPASVPRTSLKQPRTQSVPTRYGGIFARPEVRRAVQAANSKPLVAGNIDLNNRPRVRNADGSISTVRSISVNIDGREVLIPTVSDDGRILNTWQAIQQYRRTGKHLGIFGSPEEATRYAKALHDQQAAQLGTVQGSSNLGELRRLDEPEVARIQRLQREETARAASHPLDYLGTDPRRRQSRVAQIAAQRASEERVAEERQQREAPEMERLTTLYRKQIREAQNRGIGPEQWLNETAAKGVAGLTKLAGGLARINIPGTLTRWALGRDPIADTLQIHAQALQRAAEAEGVDRNVVSRLTQDVLAGIIASVPEMVAVSAGVPAPVAFGVGGGTRAIGGGESVKQIAKATGHGVATGAAFEVPGALGITNLLAKAGTVGLGTGAIEAASGQPVSEAVKAGITNALLAGAGELGRRGERPQLRPVEETPAQRRAVRIEATEADREAIRREAPVNPFLAAAELPQQQAFRQRRAERRASEVQDEAQPPVEAQRAAAQPGSARPAGVTSRGIDPDAVAQFRTVSAPEPQSDAVAQFRTVPTPLRDQFIREPGSNAPPRALGEETAEMSQRFYHRDFGEVVESPNQKRVGKGRVRVTAEDGTEHVIKRTAMTGRGNERAVPVRETATERPQSRQLPELREGENYRKPLKEYADSFYRETSAGRALEVLPTSRISTDLTADRIYLTNSPDLALGQGINKGIVLEFDPADLQGAVNTSKPTWKPLYDQGQAEFVAQYNKQGQYQQALKSVTVKPDVKMSRVERMQLDRALAEMEQQGWVKAKTPDGVVYRRLGKPIERVEEIQVEGERVGEAGGVGSASSPASPRSDPATAQPTAAPPPVESTLRPAATESQSPQVKGGPEQPAREGVRPPPESTTAVKNASMAEARARLNLPELEQSGVRSSQEVLDRAIAKNQRNPRSVDTLVEQANISGKNFTDVETAQLRVRAREIENRINELDAEIVAAKDEATVRDKQAEVDTLTAEFQRLSDATKKAGTEWGRTGVARQQPIDQNFSLVAMEARARSAKIKAGKGDLTKAERAEIKKLYRENDRLEKALAKAEESHAHEGIQQQIDRIKRTQRRTQTRANLDTEWNDLKTQFAEIRQREAGFFKSEEGAFDPEAVKLISKMVRNRVQAGVVKAEELVDEIHGVVGGDKRELRDAISGYRTQPSQRQSELQQQVNALKSELRQLSTTEDVAAGRRTATQQGPAKEFKRDQTRRKQIERQIADLEQQMTSGQFRDSKQKEPPRYTRETYRLQKELDATRAEYERLKYKVTASTGRRIADTAFGVGNVPKTLLSMGDLSALLRQGGYGSVTHPILSTRAAQDMLRSLSGRGFANVEAEIKANPLFEEAKHMGVEFTGIDRLDPRLSKREEGYLGSGFIDTIAKGKLNPLRVVKGVKDVSERTFVSFLDSQRMRIYEQQANAIKGMKLTPEQTQAALKAQAKLVNIATGRGSLGTRGNAATPALNMAMFSPRLLASRVQLLNKMFNPVAWKNTPPGARKLMMIDNAKFLGFTALTLGLAKAAGAQVNLDPDDSEFLKIKIGNTRYDTLTGLQQPMRFFYRMAMAMKGGETYAGDPAGDIVLDFARSKASPEAGYLWDSIEGKNRLSGKKFEAGKDAVRLAIPLPMQDFQEAIKTDGAVWGFVEALPSIAGVGSQTYKGAAEKPTTHAEKLARRFIIRKMPDEARTQEEIDVDAKKSELRARARRGEDVRGDIAALGSKITEKQAKGILAARNQSRLHEDVNRLGIKEAILVYSVANPQQRAELKPLLEKKAGLVSALPPDEQQKVLQQLNQFGISGGRIRISRPSRESRATR